MLLTRYIKTEKIYTENIKDEEEIISKINDTLSKEAEIEMTSKLDNESLERVSFYYNFASYSILAGAIYLICVILSSFNEKNIKKRTTISSMNYKKHNRILLLGNALFAIFLWLVYVIISFILIGDAMFTIRGLIYIVNSFIFTMCALTIAFLIGNLVNNKNTVNGIVNVVALGSSFLCGAFVPVEWLPDNILKVAHILPTYWYIQNNELMKKIEVINFETLKPVFINMGVVVIFAVGFIVITNITSKYKRKIG